MAQSWVFNTNSVLCPLNSQLSLLREDPETLIKPVTRVLTIHLSRPLQLVSGRRRTNAKLLST